MKRIIILILLLLLTMVPGFSCFVTSRETHVELDCQQLAENPTGTRNEFEVETGDKIFVELCSNPSTGFKWSYKMSGDTAVKEEDHDYQEPKSDLTGAAGKETWTFEAVKKGTAVITMEYSQPWEGGTKSEWIYTITITVK